MCLCINLSLAGGQDCSMSLCQGHSAPPHLPKCCCCSAGQLPPYPDNVSWNSQDVDLWVPNTMIYFLQSLCPRTSLEMPLFLRLQSQAWDWTEEKNGKYLSFLVIEPTQKSTSHEFLFLLSKLSVPRFLRGCGLHKNHLNFWQMKASVLLNIHKYLLVGINILEWCITPPVIISCHLLNKGTGN